MFTMFRSLCITVLMLLAMTRAQNLTTEGGQLEPILEGEVELVESKDNEFDQGLLSRVARPLEQPSQDRVAGLYNEQYKAGTIDTVEEPTSGCQADTARTGSGFTQLAEVNLYVQYMLYQDWYIDYKKCCPASQNYGCRSVRKPLPCFTTYYKGLFAWCCPLQKLAVSNCNCGKCAVFYKDCFYTGQCQRRYTYTKFAAVCYVKWWGTILHFARYLPTSCYCRQV